MPTYEIVISIAPDKVEELSNEGYSLCFAKNISGVSNVVTACYAPGAYGSDDTLFKWTEEYSISARSQPFKQGDVIEDTGTAILPVGFGDLLVVKDWSHANIQKNPNLLNPGEFGYNPVNPKYPGVSIVYVNAEPKGTNGNPCYTSANIVDGGPKNVEHLMPIAAADVYFALEVQTGSFKVDTILYPAKLEFPVGENKATLKFNKSTGQFDVVYSKA